MTPLRTNERRDDGLTLVELVVVTTVLGLVVTVVAAVFVTILRVSPATQFRIDDARSVRALQTWLVRDAASTPPREMTESADLDVGGYIFSDGITSWLGAHACGAGTGTNILHMAWKDGATTYHANYRIEDERVIRTYCTITSSGTSMTTLRLGSDVATSFCTLPNFSTVYSFGEGSAGDVQSVEVCVQTLEADTGLNAGGGDTSDVALSVSSRNYVAP